MKGIGAIWDCLRIFSLGENFGKEVRRKVVEGGGYLGEAIDNGGVAFYYFIHLDQESGDLTVTVKPQNSEGIKPFSLVVDEIWLGSGEYDNVNSRRASHFDGNTILFRKGRDCYWVGLEMVCFELNEGEKLVSFRSTVGNSCVPYGWIETNTHYLGLESFTCETGRILKEYVTPELLETKKVYLDCWSTGEEPFKTHMEKLETQEIFPRQF